MIKNIVIGALGALLLAAISSYTFFAKEKKTAYVDIAMVYNDFTLKKELEAKLANVQATRKSILDSMELSLNQLASKLQNEQFPKEHMNFQVQQYEQLRMSYGEKKQLFAEDNERTTKQYSDQIWNQINQYVKDYGKENSYTYILGADGTGAVMYADDSEDITGKIKEYVNQRYNGISK